MPAARRLTHLRKIQLLAFLCGLPGLLSTLVLLTTGDYTAKVYMTVLPLATLAWLAFALYQQAAIVRPVQTASNMLSALREGDFSLRASHVSADDPIGQLLLEINQLREVLESHRTSARDSLALLNTVLGEVEVAIFTFDASGRVSLVNQAGIRLLNGDSASAILGRKPQELGLQAMLQADLGSSRSLLHSQPATSTFGGKRYAIRRGRFRESGEPHTLLLLTDVSENLREEERMAWKRLIRVLGHELNNSIAPVKSLSGSLRKIIAQDPLPEDWREDIDDGLEVIQMRIEGLAAFMEDYARLARLPPPSHQTVDLGSLLQRLASLTPDLPIVIREEPPVELRADPAQLEQLFLNLLKNAAEASRETGGRVLVSWRRELSEVIITITDEGPGIANPENLFTPFFSTKQGGSGIGLTLSRQIAEAHEGQLTLANRHDGQSGACATLRLPLVPKTEQSRPENGIQSAV